MLSCGRVSRFVIASFFISFTFLRSILFDYVEHSFTISVFAFGLFVCNFIFNFVTDAIVLRLMGMTELSDIEYIHRIRQGDTNSYAYLVRRYQRMVFSLVVKTIPNVADAEDVTQEIFVKVYQSLSQFNASSKFSTWLYRVACNYCFSHLRRKREYTISLDDEKNVSNDYSDFEEQLENAEKEERIAWLDEILVQLPPEELWIVTLYYKESASVREIAEITRLNESNVKVKLHRARKWMKAEMEKRMRK